MKRKQQIRSKQGAAKLAAKQMRANKRQFQMAERKTAVMQYLFGALDNWQAKGRGQLSRDELDDYEIELCKAVQQLRTLIKMVHDRETLT